MFACYSFKLALNDILLLILLCSMNFRYNTYVDYHLSCQYKYIEISMKISIFLQWKFNNQYHDYIYK